MASTSFQPISSSKGFVPVDHVMSPMAGEANANQEDSFIADMLRKLDDKHTMEMEMLQKKMAELQRSYMEEKETLRVNLVAHRSNSRNARTNPEDQRQMQV